MATPALKRLCALREGSLSSKLVRVSSRGTYIIHSYPRRKPETELMGIWRVVGHATGRPDSPPRVHHRHTHSIFPWKPLGNEEHAGSKSNASRTVSYHPMTKWY
eukprot:932771-Pelagomonas_calceolata.AAC.4